MQIAGLMVIILLIVLYFVPIKDTPVQQTEPWLVSAIITALAVHGVISIAQKEEWESLSLEDLQKKVEDAFDVNGNWIEFVWQYIESDPLEMKELYGFASIDIDS